MANFSELMDLIKVNKYDTLDVRIIFQKKIYFFSQIFKLLKKPKYSYSWYIYGPYCSEATNDAFNYFDRRLDIPVEINENTEIFNKFSKEIGDNPIKWEMIASIKWIKEISGIQNKEDIFNKISKEKHYLNSRKIFDECLKILEDFELI